MRNETIEKDYSIIFDTEFERLNELRKDGILYKASQYILDLKGKRIRPMLVMMAADMYNGDLEEAIYPALTVELFHNSTLVHDDIMDASDLRRGKPTVHKIYGMNTAINTGNVLTCYAYKYLLKTKHAHLKPLMEVFTKASIQIMEGQTLDLEFEKRQNVSQNEYLQMIEQKTAVLLAASLQMGAIIGDADKDNQRNIYNFGKYLGLAFQIKDDYLDAFGDHRKIGKKSGGDILNNKKTLLHIKTFENATPDQKMTFLEILKEKDETSKITGMLDLYQSTGTRQYILDTIQDYSERSTNYLLKCVVDDERKEPLLELARDLMNRDF